MNIEDMLNDIEDIKLDTNIENLISFNGKTKKTRKEFKKQVIEYGKSKGLNCDILNEKLDRKAEDEYLKLISCGFDVSMFASKGLDAPIIKRLAYIIYQSGVFEKDDFEYSNPDGVTFIACYSLTHPELVKSVPRKYIMDLRFYSTVEFIFRHVDVLRDYMEALNEIKLKDCAYYALLDVIESLPKSELEEFRNKILNKNLSPEEKEQLICDELIPSPEGMKYVLEFSREITDTEMGNMLNEVDKLNACIAEDIFPPCMIQTVLAYTLYCYKTGRVEEPSDEEIDEMMKDMKELMEEFGMN